MQNNFKIFSILAVVILGTCAFAGFMAIGEGSDGVTVNHDDSSTDITVSAGDIYFYSEKFPFDSTISSVSMPDGFTFQEVTDDSGEPTATIRSSALTVGTYPITIHVSIHAAGYFENHSWTVTVVEKVSEETLKHTSSHFSDTAVSGDRFLHGPSYNIPGTSISKVSGDSWLSVVNSQIVGHAPSVSSPTMYSITVIATSPGGQTLTHNVPVEVYPRLSISASNESVNAFVGTAIDNISLTSNISCNYSISGGDPLPPGLTLSKGVISGIPTSVGDFAVYVYAVGGGNSSVNNDGVTITFSVKGEFSITSTPPVDAVAGGNYTYTPVLSTSDGLISISKVSGASWLNCNGGIISGMAPVVSVITDYSATFILTCPVTSATIEHTVHVKVYPVLSIDPLSLSLMMGDKMTGTIVISNLLSNYTLGDGFSVPLGLSFTNGYITGTPSEIGTFIITVNAVSHEGPSQNATGIITFNISGMLSVTSSPPSDPVVVGNKYSYIPSASIPGAVFSISGAPSWLVFQDGKIIGVVPGDFTDDKVSFVLTVTYGSQTVTQNVTFDIDSVPNWTSKPTSDMLITAVDEFTFKFIFTGNQAETLKWYFGDGAVSTEWSPSHVYAKSGTYTVTCTAVNSQGETVSSKTLTITSEPLSLIVKIIVVIVVLVLICLVIWLVLRRQKNKGRSR